MDIWPAIDLRHGKPVRLRQGDYDQQTTFGDDPVEFARRWQSEGARRLHLVDLDAARGDDPTANREAVRRIIEETDLPCQMGGGVRDEATVTQLLDLGVARLVVGSRALKDPDWFATMCDQFPGKLAAGIDAREGRVAAEGWLETSDVEAVELAQLLRKKTDHIAAVIYTDIAKDGMMQGVNFEGLLEMMQATDIPLVASGGVTTLADVRCLKEAGIPAAIIGRSLYDGAMQLSEVLDIAEDRPADSMPN